jgi:hypothetical protein
MDGSEIRLYDCVGYRYGLLLIENNVKLCLGIKCIPGEIKSDRICDYIKTNKDVKRFNKFKEIGGGVLPDVF